MEVIKVTNGVFWIDIPESKLFILCGSPADVIKHLKKKGLIVQKVTDGVFFESGPNAVLLSDISIQNGQFSNLCEFPVMHMLYKQGLGIPGHPNNNGTKPLLIGQGNQVRAQCDYLYRGQYGLVSEDEIRASGIDDENAYEYFRIKQGFAFSQIKKPEELVDYCVPDANPVTVRHDVSVQRLKTNVYKFIKGKKSVTVDLNLSPAESYESAVTVDFHRVRREYFSVVHIGEGDGWDINKPCAGSVVMFQGRIFLVDCGPYVLQRLQALGIGINEIEGVFMTHGHDDHFAGLMSVMYTDHRLKFISSPLVRHSVMKKLSALMSVSEHKCEQAFEIVDLKLNKWNNLEGLQVMPVYSPHPVETNVFLFKAFGIGGSKIYAHLLDIPSLATGGKMILEYGKARDAAEKINYHFRQAVKSKADLKKVDIGGGMIHGNVADFAEDKKSKIMLSHKGESLSAEEKDVGATAGFGMVDVLIPATQDYLMQSAAKAIRAFYPEAPDYDFRMLLNCPEEQVNVGDLILRKGEKQNPVCLILSGVVEVINDAATGDFTLAPGSFLGDSSIFSSKGCPNTYRAASYVRMLKIPFEVFEAFIGANYHMEKLAKQYEVYSFLQNTRLFGEQISSVAQMRMARLAVSLEAKKGAWLEEELGEEGLYLIREGEVVLTIDQYEIGRIGSGDFFNEESLFSYNSNLITPQALTAVKLYRFPIEELKDIPILEWKMLEAFERRLTAFGMLSAAAMQ